MKKDIFEMHLESEVSSFRVEKNDKAFWKSLDRVFCSCYLEFFNLKGCYTVQLGSDIIDMI